MAHRTRIDPAARQALADDIKARRGDLSTRQLAAAHGVSETTVRRVSAEIGVDAGAARARTENATEQVKARCARLRAELEERFLVAAHEALDELGKGSVIAGIALGVPVSASAARLTARDRRELLTAAAIGFDKAKAADQYEQGETDASDVAKVIRFLTGREQ